MGRIVRERRGARRTSRNSEVRKLGRAMELWPGTCIVHDTFSERKMIALKERHPDAEILAHPECDDVILKMADYVGSTTGILDHATKSAKRTFIVATEPGILHPMRREAPDKVFIAAPPEASCACNECPHMKLNTLEKLYLCMRDRQPELLLSREIQQAALLPLQRMLILFEEGTRLGKRCQELLDLAELRIKQVVEEADGTVRVAAFDVGSSIDGSPAF